MNRTSRSVDAEKNKTLTLGIFFASCLNYSRRRETNPVILDGFFVDTNKHSFSNVWCWLERFFLRRVDCRRQHPRWSLFWNNQGSAPGRLRFKNRIASHSRLIQRKTASATTFSSDSKELEKISQILLPLSSSTLKVGCVGTLFCFCCCSSSCGWFGSIGWNSK